MACGATFGRRTRTSSRLATWSAASGLGVVAAAGRRAGSTCAAPPAGADAVARHGDEADGAAEHATRVARRDHRPRRSAAAGRARLAGAGTQEEPRVSMLRRTKRSRSRRLDHLARVRHGVRVSDTRHDARVVRDQQDRQPIALTTPAFAGLRLYGHVSASSARRATSSCRSHQHHRDHDTLARSAKAGSGRTGQAASPGRSDTDPRPVGSKPRSSASARDRALWRVEAPRPSASRWWKAG